MNQQIAELVASYYKEDGLLANSYYFSKLPNTRVNCTLFFKDDLIISGLNFFSSAIQYLYPDFDDSTILEFEGKRVSKSDNTSLSLELPFSVALSAERIALNLLQRSSSVSTYTAEYVKLAAPFNIKILDTRKTTPGLRALEKYAVRLGGGYNHRMSQTDVWMVKDNHKSFFGGLKQAVDFFKDTHSFYTPMVVEIHSKDEFFEALNLGVQHVMLDNFSPAQVKELISEKPKGVTVELSGGMRLSNIKDYLINGVDAISVGALTYDAPHRDISFKYKV